MSTSPSIIGKALAAKRREAVSDPAETLATMPPPPRPAGTPLVTKQQWDTDYFGFNVAYVQQRTLTPVEQRAIEEFVVREKIVLLQYLCNCHDRESVLTAEDSGYSFVDVRYTLLCPLPSVHASTDAGPFRFARGTAADIPRLREIAHDAYRDSRYYFDSHFDLKKVREFYQEWVEKGVRGALDDYVDVLYDGDVPVAFCAIKEHPGRQAKIGLIGVDAARRGAGVGTILVRNVLGELQERGFSSVGVVTQGRNYPAQRLYQKCGFATEMMELWYHKWYV